MDSLERIADAWYERANELARWAMQRLVNRTDVWGRYHRRHGDETPFAVTAPFQDERGKVFLNLNTLRKHFRTRKPSGHLGLHSASSDLTSRWLAIDIGLDDPDDGAQVRARNLSAARGWYRALLELGFDPLLMDSNGSGGFHLLVLFTEPMSTSAVHDFGKRLLADYARLGLNAPPQLFPENPRWDHYGEWLRLPGRHQSRPHYTRVWNNGENDAVDDDMNWLDGHDAIDGILGTRTAAVDVLELHGIFPARRTICLDFDGVLHSNRSGWLGSDVIPDPPIRGTREAVAQLREQYRVVVYSPRCHAIEGRAAIEMWLRRHDIVVDEVCEHKPPATVYLDNCAVQFRGSWLDALDEIRDFRK